MPVGQISILSKEDIELVHANTLTLLERPGVSVQSDSALRALEEGGAAVDKKMRRAKLPEGLVQETLRKMPKAVRLGARNPRQDMQAPKKGPPYMATNGTAVYVADMETGARRPSKAKDLKDFMVLADALSPLDYVWPIVTAHDGLENAHGLNDLVICLENTTKHVQGEAMSAEEALAMIEVGAAVAGGSEALAKRPLFSVIQCPICPLEFERGSADAVVEFAKAGIPVVSMSMALCGLTAPVTVASAVAIVNAENIASFAISQMAKAGAPVVYSTESSPINMKTGEIRYGAMEQTLIAAAAGQMARHYGAPTMLGVFGAGLHGERPGMTLDPSEFAFTTMTNLALTDFSSGIGGIDQAKGAALEQMVIDCDIWESVKEVRREVMFDHERFAVDLIDKVGPGGSFLKEPHTVKNMRKELFLPNTEKARVFSTYRLDADRGRMVEQARERARKMLAEHRPESLHPDAKDGIEKIMKRHRA